MSQSQAAAPAGYTKYFIPGDEDLLLEVLDEISADAEDGPMHAEIAVTAWTPNTTLYWDHWEDGYDYDPNDPGNTADEIVTLTNTGDAQLFTSFGIPLNRTVDVGNAANINQCDQSDSNDSNDQPCYDGRDILYVAGGAVTVTRAGWDEDRGTVLSVAWEVYPVRPQLIQYILPFGEDLALNDGLDDFERVYAFVQATADGTQVQVDFNDDGTYDAIDFNRDGDCTDANDGTSVTLAQGQVLLLSRDSDGNGGSGCTVADDSLNTGTTLLASRTVQVQYIIGDENSSYEIRGLSAFPRGFWDDEYYAPVDEPAADDQTDIYLYNPHDEPLTINYETRSTASSFTIAPKTTASFRAATGGDLEEDSAVFLKESIVAVAACLLGYLYH
ncbi:MAG: hypothetical protein R3F37_22270 [Candidatus Competibacteraceae bacterium]